MPIKLIDDFPARAILEKEDIFAINNQRADSQDIRPLKLVILNLMPNKIDTETQLLRLISQSPLQIDVDFLKIKGHIHKHTSLHHLNKFYLEFADIKDKCYDGLIITGAPIEKLAFEEVNYWAELQRIMNWGATHTTSVFHICWGAQAGLYQHYGIEKQLFNEKLFGVYPQEPKHHHRLLRGFDDVFNTPQSRYTGINDAQVAKCDKLEVIARSEEIGNTIIVSKDDHDLFVLGHFEYDTETLGNEFKRDHERGVDTQVPYHYFKGDTPDGKVVNTWRGHSHLLYHNWLNDVYQMTTYDINDIVSVNEKRLGLVR